MDEREYGRGTEQDPCAMLKTAKLHARIDTQSQYIGAEDIAAPAPLYPQPYIDAWRWSH
jgi:hypothetical protein